MRTGHLDGKDNTIPPADKLGRLQAVDRAWKDLTFGDPFRITLPGPIAFYQLRGGVLLYGSSSKLGIVNLATHSGTGRERQWSLGDLGLEHKICASSDDPARDLLVVVEERDR